MTTRKISVTVDDELVDAVKGRVGVRGVSSFVSRAIRHELEREELGELLAELEDVLGPADEQLVTEAARAFDGAQKPASRPSRRRTA